MSKRKTKEQREAEQYNALWQRVYDIVAGACGDKPINDIPISPDYLSKAIPAMANIFDPEAKKPYLWAVYNLDHYGFVDDITQFLFEHGIRA